MHLKNLKVGQVTGSITKFPQHLDEPLCIQMHHVPEDLIPVKPLHGYNQDMDAHHLRVRIAHRSGK